MKHTRQLCQRLEAVICSRGWRTVGGGGQHGGQQFQEGDWALHAPVGIDHPGLKSLNMVLCSMHMLSGSMFGQQSYSI